MGSLSPLTVHCRLLRGLLSYTSGMAALGEEAGLAGMVSSFSESERGIGESGEPPMTLFLHAVACLSLALRPNEGPSLLCLLEPATEMGVLGLTPNLERVFLI